MTESIIEQAALAWLKSLGWTVKHGPEIAPGDLAAERADYGQIVLTQRLQDALARLNPTLPAEALSDAFRKFTRPERPTLEARNRAFHRMLVDGVTVEHRTADGSIRGAQAQVLDLDNLDNNDWLAVNQFTVSEHKHTRRPDVVLFINGLPLALIELKTPPMRTPPSGRLSSSSRPTRRSSRRCSPSIQRWSSPTALRPASARSPLAASGSNPGARSRARAWPIPICQSYR